MTRSILTGLAGGVAIAASALYLRYRRDMNAARARLDAVERLVVSTRWGAVECAERGSGADTKRLGRATYRSGCHT